MKFATVALCALLFASVSWSGAEAFECTAASASCKSLAVLKFFVVGNGKCVGKAGAACKAAALAHSCKASVFAKFKGGCPSAVLIKAFASCYANAVAQAYAAAFTKISCVGKAKGCGFAHANAKAWACSYAAAFIETVIELGGHAAVCYTHVGAVSGLFVKAAANAHASVCGKGTFTGVAFGKAMASAYQEAFVYAFAKCFAACDYGTVSIASGGAGAQTGGGSSTGGSSGSGSSGTVISSGSGSAGAIFGRH